MAVGFRLQSVLVVVCAMFCVAGCGKIMGKASKKSKNVRFSIEGEVVRSKDKSTSEVVIRARGPKGKKVTVGDWSCTLVKRQKSSKSGDCEIRVNRRLFPERISTLEATLKGRKRPHRFKIKRASSVGYEVVKLSSASKAPGIVLTFANSDFKNRNNPIRFKGLKVGSDLKGEWDVDAVPGAKLRFMGKKVALDKKGKGRIKVDLSNQVWDAPMRKSKQLLLDIPASFEFTPPKKSFLKKATVKGTFTIKHWSKVFAEVAQKGVLAPGEEAVAQGKRGMMWSDLSGSLDFPKKLARSIKTMRDIDVVVLKRNQESGERKCGPYGSQRLYKTMVLYKSQLTAYDRRTGKKLASRSFKSDALCPKSLKVWVDSKSGKASGGNFSGKRGKGALSKAITWAGGLYGD